MIVKSKYISLSLRLFCRALIDGKLSFQKVYNFFSCYMSYSLAKLTSGCGPTVVSFELSNVCNARCPFCRTPSGSICNRNPHGENHKIQLGTMDFELYKCAVDSLKNSTLVVVLYVNGEPLVYSKIIEAIKHAADQKLITIIATNGMLLDDKHINDIIVSGLDFMKIAISGFTQEIYSKQHINCKIDTVKDNLVQLSSALKSTSSTMVVMVDYILYNYNKHEMNAAKKFVEDLGFIFNVRRGINPGMGHVETHPMQPSSTTNRSNTLCDWPWKALTINWNGDVLPCCDYAVWSPVKPYLNITVDNCDLPNIWNSEVLKDYRRLHIEKRRSASPICKTCSRQGTDFTY